jgi:hypothetical protein
MSSTHRDAKAEISGTITAVKARIRLLRSFDQIHHSYLGYVLVLDGTLDGTPAEGLRLAVGPKAHEKHEFRIGDQTTGKAVAVPDPETEWARWYKVSELRMISRGPADQDVPPNPEGGIAPPLPDYRERGHRRLDKSTHEAHCQPCPFGLVMATQIIIDQWNPTRQKWRYETHCYGPRDCPRYRAGKPYRVQGRQPGMVWVDDDVEREERDRGG